MQNNQGGNRGGNRGGGNHPPQQGGGGTPPPTPPAPPAPAPEPEWDRIVLELLDAAHDVLEIPDRIRNLSNPKLRFIQTLSFVEAKVGGGGNPVTNADAEARKDAAVYRLGNYTPPAAPGGGTPTHNPPGGHNPTGGGQGKKPGFWDGFWGRGNSNQGGHH